MVELGVGQPCGEARARAPFCPPLFSPAWVNQTGEAAEATLLGRSVSVGCEGDHKVWQIEGIEGETKGRQTDWWP